MTLVIRPTRLPACLAALLSVTLAGWAGANVVHLTPSKDNTLIESPLNNSNGAGDGIFVGKTATAGLRRGVLAFNLSAIPAGSTINSVTLTLTMTQSVVGDETDTVHRLLADWGEAGSAGSGQGAPAQPGDATWTFRFFNTTAWAAAGGDFVGGASAAQVVGGAGSYAWSGSGLVADVQFWKNNPSQNFGWMLRGPEATSKSAKKFGSRESTAPPLCDIDYTPPSAAVAPGSDLEGVRFASPWPVPARGAVNLAFELPGPAHVWLAIHDVTGRLVRPLIDGADQTAGPHTIVWDGRTDRGARAPAGIYVARLVVNGAAYERRVPQLR